jgi:predicted nucleic acid-binding protein
MESKVFLDANIVLDLLSQERPNHHQAKLLILRLIEKDMTVCISEDILTTVYYVAKDKQRVVTFFQTIQKRWEILSFGQVVIADALAHAAKHQCDLEDTLQCLCAVKEGCSMVVTEDSSFVACGVKIMNYESVLHEIG